MYMRHLPDGCLGLDKVTGGLVVAHVRVLDTMCQFSNSSVQAMTVCTLSTGECLVEKPAFQLTRPQTTSIHSVQMWRGLGDSQQLPAEY
jgi:hypothetical protein